MLVLDQWDRATEKGRIQLIRTQEWSEVHGPVKNTAVIRCDWFSYNCCA